MVGRVGNPSHIFTAVARFLGVESVCNPPGTPRQQGQRIDQAAKIANLEVEVRAGDVAVGAGRADDLALAHHFARLDVNVAQVRVEGDIVDAVIDDDAEPVARRVPAGHDHLAAVGGLDGRAGRNSDIEGHVTGARALREGADHRPDELTIAVRPVSMVGAGPAIRCVADRGPIGPGRGCGAGAGQQHPLARLHGVGRAGETVPGHCDDLGYRQTMTRGDAGQRIAGGDGVAQIIQRGHGDDLTGRQRLGVGAGGRGGARHRLQITAKIECQRPKGIAVRHDIGETRDVDIGRAPRAAEQSQRQKPEAAPPLSLRCQQQQLAGRRRLKRRRWLRRGRGDHRSRPLGGGRAGRTQGQNQGQRKDQVPGLGCNHRLRTRSMLPDRLQALSYTKLGCKAITQAGNLHVERVSNPFYKQISKPGEFHRV